LGAEVAAALGYELGQPITLSHGVGEGSFNEHAAHPVIITGLLKRTGTPADRTVHISLQTLEALHGAAGADPTPESLTAFIVGLRERTETFQIQRDINEYRGEALLAILPGVALQQLWEVAGVAESALLLVSGFVLFAGLLGLLTALLTSLNERRREMAILRSVGARPLQVFALLMSEAALIGLTGAVLGLAALHGGLALAAGRLEDRFGVYLLGNGLTTFELIMACAVVLAAVSVGAIPGWRAYRHTLTDGLTLRL
jgi:putative ABC transport system permease protein